eukprot:scaffold70281_cov67-Cyclotella_meneghiniana.AAC.5
MFLDYKGTLRQEGSSRKIIIVSARLARPPRRISTSSAHRQHQWTYPSVIFMNGARSVEWPDPIDS